MSASRGDRDALVARAMNTFPEAVPYLSALCEDFEGLGTDVDAAMRLLDDAGASAGFALDLGCGKGSHAVALCCRGWHVRAVDIHEPFLDETRRRARDAGVEGLCETVDADLVHETERTKAQSVDLSMLLAIGRPWGTLVATIGALRRTVRAGGLILVDDAFLEADGATPPEYEGYTGLEETEHELTKHGDQLVGRVIPSIAEAKAQHERELGWLRARGAEIAARDPESVGVINRFLAMQEGAYEDLVGPVRGATWLLRRSDD